MGEKTLHEEKKNIHTSSMWIPIGAYKIYSTANDMSEWNVKKRIQLAANFKGGSTHAT